MCVHFGCGIWRVGGSVERDLVCSVYNVLEVQHVCVYTLGALEHDGGWGAL